MWVDEIKAKKMLKVNNQREITIRMEELEFFGVRHQLNVMQTIIEHHQEYNHMNKKCSMHNKMQGIFFQTNQFRRLEVVSKLQILNVFHQLLPITACKTPQPLLILVYI
jgi:hypothetical protein